MSVSDVILDLRQVFEEFDTAFLLGPVCWGIKREEKKEEEREEKRWCLVFRVQCVCLVIWGRTKEPTYH